MTREEGSSERLHPRQDYGKNLWRSFGTGRSVDQPIDDHPDLLIIKTKKMFYCLLLTQ